jgi:hypothetical protein
MPIVPPEPPGSLAVVPCIKSRVLRRDSGETTEAFLSNLQVAGTCLFPRPSQCKRAESCISSKVFSPAVFSALIESLRYNVPSFNCRFTVGSAHEAIVRNLRVGHLAKPFGLLRGESHLQATSKPPLGHPLAKGLRPSSHPTTPIQAAWPDAVSLTSVRYRFRHKPSE